MTEFGLGIVLLWVGYRLLRSTRPRVPDLLGEQQNKQERIRLWTAQEKALEAQANALELQIKLAEQIEQYKEQREQLHQGSELNERVAQDALLQATKLRAALIETLKYHGAEQDMIDRVLAHIDGE